MKLKDNVDSAVLATLISIVVAVLLTLLSELYSPFEDFLKLTFGHHWIGKALIVTVLFFGLTFAFKNKKFEKYDLFKLTNISFVAGVILILLFYLWEFFA